MTQHYVNVDLDDPRTGEIAEILANKTSTKILGLLAENEMSVSDVAAKLKIPLNTADYNFKKLAKAGLIEQTRHFWSVKGKKVPTYRAANKKIVITPKSSIKGIIPAVVITGVAAVGIKYFLSGVSNVAHSTDSFRASESVGIASEKVASSDMLTSGVYGVLNNAPPSWAWFLLGALTALLVFVLWNWRNYVKN